MNLLPSLHLTPKQASLEAELLGHEDSSAHSISATATLLEAQTIPPLPLYVLLAVDALHSADLHSHSAATVLGR